MRCLARTILSWPNKATRRKFIHEWEHGRKAGYGRQALKGKGKEAGDELKRYVMEEFEALKSKSDLAKQQIKEALSIEGAPSHG